MTQEDWLVCNEPQRMLEFLRGKVSERKLCRLSCAFCRSIWHLLPDRRSRHAVETAERFADGRADERQLIAAWNGAIEARKRMSASASEHGIMLRNAIRVFWSSRGESPRAWQAAWPIGGPELFLSTACILLVGYETPATVAAIHMQCSRWQGLGHAPAAALLQVLEVELEANPHGPLATAAASARITLAQSCAALAVQRASWMPEKDFPPIDVVKAVARYAAEAAGANEKAAQATLIRGAIRCADGS
jgi:hypothetical protein